MRNADQVAEFRTKLIDSKFFASVTVEEQTPTPDRQKVNIRITALWKPANVLQSLAIGPTAEEIEKARNKKDSPPGGMPMGFPGGMPPGMMPSGALPASPPPGLMPPGARPAGGPPGVAIRPSESQPPPVRKEAKE
jgi:small nuclear ribonucleoprotein B and B'